MKRLEDVVSFLKGKSLSKSDIIENGKYECIRYGELYTYYEEVINQILSRTNLLPKDNITSLKNDVLIPSSGETQIDIAKASSVQKDGIILGGDLNILRGAKSGPFLSYYINGSLRYKIAIMAQGNSVVHLYSSQLKSLKISLPTLPEQKKIAECLSSLDELITIHGDRLDGLKDYKRGLMQKLFPADGQTTPTLRFPEFQGKAPWEVKPLNSVLDYGRPDNFFVSSTNYSTEGTPVLTANKSFILGYTKETDGIFKDTPVIIFDDFTTDKKYVDFPFKIKSSAIKILKQKGNDNLKLIFELMNKISLDAKEHKRYYISEYQNLSILLPKPDEQQKIADCLSVMDDLITAQEQKIKTLKHHKNGLMQQLFPQL